MLAILTGAVLDKKMWGLKIKLEVFHIIIHIIIFYQAFLFGIIHYLLKITKWRLHEQIKVNTINYLNR